MYAICSSCSEGDSLHMHSGIYTSMHSPSPHLAAEGTHGVLQAAGPLAEPVHGVEGEANVQGAAGVVAHILAAADAGVGHGELREVVVDLLLILLGALEELCPAIPCNICVGHVQLQLPVDAFAAQLDALIECIADGVHWSYAVAPVRTAPFGNV